MIFWAGLARAVVVGPEQPLQAVVDQPGDHDLELRSGVYTAPLVIRGKTVSIRAAPGANPVIGGLALDERPQILVAGGTLRIEGVDVVPTNRAALVVTDGGNASLDDLDMEVLGGGRLVEVRDGLAELSGVQLTGGSADQGGQILVGSLGTLRLDGGVLSGGRADRGGSAFVAGTLEAQGVVFSGHQAEVGGALHCVGTCTLDGGALLDNAAEAEGGAVFVGIGRVVTLRDVLVQGNRGGDGGGLWAQDATVVLERSTFCGNVAQGVEPGDGGAVFLERVAGAMEYNRFLLNDARRGGAVYALGLQVPMVFPTLVGNRALQGAALYGEGTLVRALVGHQRGGVVLQPAPGRSISVPSSEFFLNGAELHPTLMLEDQEKEFLRQYAPTLPCGVVDDRFVAGSDPVLAAREQPSGRPADERGAYALGGIDSGDADGDGYPGVYDCNDRNPDVYPARVDKETPYDGLDENCDGFSDFDADRDGVDIGEDCDDQDPTIRPGVPDADPLMDRDCNQFTEDTAPDLRAAACTTGPSWPTTWFTRRR